MPFNMAHIGIEQKVVPYKREIPHQSRLYSQVFCKIIHKVLLRRTEGWLDGAAKCLPFNRVHLCDVTMRSASVLSRLFITPITKRLPFNSRLDFLNITWLGLENDHGYV